MIETIVSLKTVKLLKEREFSVNTNAYYDDCNKLQVDSPYESYYYRVMKVGQYFSLSYNPFKGNTS